MRILIDLKGGVMPKKIKLNLDNLKVSSFKTSEDLKGGVVATINCGSDYEVCDNTRVCYETQVLCRSKDLRCEQPGPEGYEI
jgi:hypothetical protein